MGARLKAGTPFSCGNVIESYANSGGRKMGYFAGALLTNVIGLCLGMSSSGVEQEGTMLPLHVMKQYQHVYFTDETKDPVVFRSGFAFSTNGTGVAHVITGKNQHTEINGHNEKYAFTLRRENEGQWKLVYLAISQDDPEWREIKEKCRRAMITPYAVYGFKDEPAIFVRDRSAEGTLSFDAQGKGAIKHAITLPSYVIRSGNVLLRPERELPRIAEFSFDVQWFRPIRLADGTPTKTLGKNGTITGQYQYDGSSDQLLKRTRFLFSPEGEKSTIHETSYAWIPIEIERSRLGYYGLDEPFGAEWPRPTPWWLYLAGGTVFFFVLALLLGVAIRRLNARAAG